MLFFIFSSHFKLFLTKGRFGMARMLMKNLGEILGRFGREGDGVREIERDFVGGLD